MIEWKRGNLFDSKCNIWVNPVNCEGVMGKGIALEFKKKFPFMFSEYKQYCKYGELSKGGDLFLYISTEHISFPKQYPVPTHIICFATKESWRNRTKLEWIERGLKSITEIEWLANPSFAFPKLGCGNGGLDWIRQVKPLMIKYLDPFPYKVEIYI